TARPQGQDEYRPATQWFLVSNMAMTTFNGPDGLHVFIERLSDGEAMGGAGVELVGRDNTVLKQATVGDDGYVHIAPEWLAGRGGNRPALLTASSTDGTDFNFVNLREAGFDLSDRGVAGTPAPDTVNLFATTERGIYRPGDSVYITALMRDLESRAMEKLPLTVIVQRPDGKEASRHTLED